jgi:hypothetical protein
MAFIAHFIAHFITPFIVRQAMFDQQRKDAEAQGR